jgi:enediyne biosynthesis protein E4
VSWIRAVGRRTNYESSLTGLAKLWLVGVLVTAASCSSESAEDRAQEGQGAQEEQLSPGPRFVDRAGFEFVLDNGFDGEHWRVAETIAGGLALIDYDGDGWLDIYFTNGRKMEPGSSPSRNTLYKNLGDGSFEDVSKDSEADDSSMSLGVCAADIDGDGRVDLYVTNMGPNRLYMNRGGGKFEDVAAEAGLASESLDTGCVFFDMDADGDLDLYVASYVIDDKTEQEPAILRGSPGYWPPTTYEAAPDHLYENLGNMKFADVSEASGIWEQEPLNGLGVIASDFNSDGHMDLYVANDLTPNLMLLGDGEGKFEDAAFLNGTAFGELGDSLGSMGLDAGDFNGDGHTDLVVTNYEDQPNNLYRGLDGEEYEDRSSFAGIDAKCRAEVSWGVGFGDVNHDGRVDLFLANGHLNPHAHEIDDSRTYAQKNRVFRNKGDRFENMTELWGKGLSAVLVSRGSAFGDLDNDGDLDLVVSNIGAPAQVLHNEMVSPFRWAKVQLEGSKQNRGAIGARVTITSGASTQWRERRSSTSFLSASDPVLHFGLGEAQKIESLHVRWPDGSEVVHEDIPVGRVITVRQGAETVELSPEGN